MGDYIPTSDTIYQDWLANFISVANTNLVSLGLLATEISPLSTEKTSFDTAITDLQTRKAAMKSATQTKDTLKKSTIAKARALVKRIQAKAEVTNALKAQLQITVPGNAPVPPEIPFPPTDLVANIIGAGSYELTWKRNGNSTNTLFAIEAIIGTAIDFSQIYVTTKASYIHAGNPPGIKITYRVKGQRGEIQGPPSNHAVVNDMIILP